jgi:GGDEF domain-containing protein
MLALGMTRGVLIGLLMISVWIAVKQLLGIWDGARLLDHLLELILAGLTFIFGGRHHDRLLDVLDAYQESQSQLKQLDLEDKTTGLLKPSIGLLRLREEEERSVRYRRPMALILILVRPRPGQSWEADESQSILRAIATSMKDTTRETDIPFLLRKDKIALLLPETQTYGANTVVNNILNRVTVTQFVTESGGSMFVHERVQLRYGFAAFLGAGEENIDILAAAEGSLQRSLEINLDDLFQNIFIEWATIGKLPVSTPLFEKVNS